MSSQSQLLSMDFDSSKTPAYMDPVEFNSYMDSGLDSYLQYPQSPAFTGLGLPQTTSPVAFNSSLSLSGSVGDYTYSSMGAPSPARPYTPTEGNSISPHTLTYSLSAGEMSSDNNTSGRASRGSGTHSPPASVPYQATVPRSSQRFNPIAATATSRPILKHKRRASRSNDESEDEDEEFTPAVLAGGASDSSRRETIRRQRIESEQRRRDELRDGYARLKETLPPSNQKSSKVSLLERATGHIRYLETVKEQLELRLKSAEAEVHRLRNVNEALMLGAASQRAQGAF